MLKFDALENDHKEDDKLNKLKFLWEEYKYRHELCWKLIFQITVAVVIILFVPYTKPDIANSLGDWTLALPIIAFILVLFSRKRLSNELRILDTIRAKYRKLQLRVYCIRHYPPHSTFTKDVKLYFLGLGVMCLVGVFAVIFPELPFYLILLIIFIIGLVAYKINLYIEKKADKKK